MAHEPGESTEEIGVTVPYRTALVTGASRGIGAAICARLAALGLEVHAVARDAAALESLSGATGAITHVCDVTDHVSLAAALDGVELDVLVNNAGLVATVAPLHALTPEALDQMIDVNLRAPLHLMRVFLPGMIARRRGHIINIGSTSGSSVFGGTAVYSATKAGMTAASRVTRYDLAGSGVRLTEISPGRVETDIYLAAFGGDRTSLQDKLYRSVRALKPDNVAAAVVHALTMPEHVDISFLEIVPTDQASGGQVFADPPK